MSDKVVWKRLTLVGLGACEDVFLSFEWILAGADEMNFFKPLFEVWGKLVKCVLFFGGFLLFEWGFKWMIREIKKWVQSLGTKAAYFVAITHFLHMGKI